MSGGTLYVVATPIGNLGDLSDRAKDLLCRAPLVAAEDTRRARTLVRHVGARTRLISFHAHSPRGRTQQILAALAQGDDVVLLTDAGTPAVSDPGADLVAAARTAGHAVVAVPGPSAVTAALSISGFSADRYLFLGFLPRRGRARRELLVQAAASPWTVVLFEAPLRLVALLHELATACGDDRPAVVARELTKLHEECNSGTLLHLAGYYEREPPRGEVTVVLAGTGGSSERKEDADPRAVATRARALLHDGLSRRDTADRLAQEFAVSRREAYGVVNELQRERGRGQDGER